MATLRPLPLYSLIKSHTSTPPIITVCSDYLLNHEKQYDILSTIQKTIDPISSVSYNPGLLDHVFLNLFRNKMVQEVGWDSEKPSYDGLIDVANRLMVARTNSETKDAAVRILKSLFPPLLLELYKIIFAPVAQGKPAAVMILSTKLVSLCSLEARVTALSCQCLMGTCTVNNVDLPDGSSLPSGEFFMDHMGVPLLMEPNFSDYSCQFKFGISPPEDDSTLKEPCLDVCPNATLCRTAATNTHEMKCPKA